MSNINSAEYHSASQPSAMNSSNTEIKSENISDIEENEEYLCAMARAPPEENADTIITSDYNDGGIYGTTLESYQVSRLETNDVFEEKEKHPYVHKMKTEREEDIDNTLPEYIDANVISDLGEANIESGTHLLNDGMTCKIEEAQILFGTEFALEKAQSSSESANGKGRLKQKLPNWLDGTETFTLKEELTEDTSPDRPKGESFIAQYSLECETSTKDPPYKCHDCEKKFTKKSSLHRHQMSQHSKLKPHNCPECEMSFVTKYQLHRHQMLEHSRPKPYKCPNCDMSFVDKRNLEQHQVSRHLELKPHKCPDCEKRFTQKAHLHRHQMSQHLKLKPHKCPDCEKSFVTKYQRLRHQMLEHSRPKPYKCPDCEKGFTKKSNLHLHQMSQHSKLKPHKCPECEKSFVTKYQLHRHQMLEHSRPKPYKCSDCDMSFVDKRNLAQHQVSRHSKLTPYKCPDCEKGFVTKQTLERHQISLHSKQVV